MNDFTIVRDINKELLKRLLEENRYEEAEEVIKEAMKKLGYISGGRNIDA